MSTRIRESVKKISHGTDLEKALPEYLEQAMDIHDSHARLKFMMEYYVFYEMISEGINPYIDSAKDIADALHQAVRVLMDPAGFDETERKKQGGVLLDLRGQVTDRMQVLTAYVDRFVIYEYILNRLQYRFEDQEVIAEDSVFAQEVLNFIFSTKDNMAINDNIRMVIGQLPVRMTRSHYFDLIRDSISVYKGSDRSALDGHLYMFRTNAMLYHTEDMEKYFTVVMSGDYVEHPKPAPDTFLVTAEKLGMEPEDCLVVEDSTNGGGAARAAGMKCIWFHNPDSGRQDIPDAVLEFPAWTSENVEKMLKILEKEGE